MNRNIKGFMFDTQIFDLILAGDRDPNIFPEGIPLYITHIQQDEIVKCPDENRRHKLLTVFHTLKMEEVATASAVIGVSRIGKCRISDAKLLEDLRKGNSKHTNDALIGETCIKEGLVLVTEDKTLTNRVRQYSGEAISYQDFLKWQND